MFTVYVLVDSTKQHIYVGQTRDPERRLIEHNAKTSHYTSKYQPWNILFCEKVQTRSEAMIKEKQLKSQKGRNYIKKMMLAKASVS